MAREKFPSDDIDRLMVRFPPGMRARLAEEAKANGRSMNSEIVSRLHASLESQGGDMIPKAAAEMAEANLRLMLDAAQQRYEEALTQAEARIRKSVFIAGVPLEIDGTFVEEVTTLLEKARARHDAKHGIHPPDEREPFEGPLRPQGGSPNQRADPEGAP